MDIVFSLFEFYNIVFFVSFCLQSSTDPHWTIKRCYAVAYYINVLNEKYLKQNNLESLYFVCSCLLAMFGICIDSATKPISYVPVYMDEMHQIIWLTTFVNFLYAKYDRQNANLYTLYLKAILVIFVIMSSENIFM